MSKEKSDSISGGIFLVGLGALFLLDWFWPGILLLIGVVGLVHESMQGKVWSGLAALLILGGLTVVFTFNWNWSMVFPIVLISLGVVGIANVLRGR